MCLDEPGRHRDPLESKGPRDVASLAFRERPRLPRHHRAVRDAYTARSSRARRLPRSLCPHRARRSSPGPLDRIVPLVVHEHPGSRIASRPPAGNLRCRFRCDLARREQLRGELSWSPIARPDHRHGVAWANPGRSARLPRSSSGRCRRASALLVRDAVGHNVGGRVREGNPDVLGLGAVESSC